MSISWTTAGNWLLHSGLGGGLLLLVTVALMRWASQPVQRQRLGEWGLAATLVLAVLCLFPSWLILPWPVTGEPLQAEASRELIPFEEENAWPNLEEDPAALPPAALVVENSVEAEADAAPEITTSTAGLVVIGQWVVLGFGLRATLFLGHWLLSHVALAHLLRQATPAPTDVANLFAAMTAGRRKVRSLMSQRLRVPVSCGLFRPTVILPAPLCHFPDERKLCWVFAHELTHLERRDAWSSVLFGLGQAVYFYLPWFWWLRRQVRLCQEFIADAAAIRLPVQKGGGDGAVDYAEFLLSLTKTPAVPVAATAVSGNTSDLFRRVSMLLQNSERVEGRPSRTWSLLVGGVLLGLAVLASGIGLRAEAQQPTVIIISGNNVLKDTEDKTRLVLAQKYQKILELTEKGDAQLEPLRKALEKLEKHGGKLDPVQIRQEILKALEGLKDGKVAEKTKPFAIEIHIETGADKKKSEAKATPSANEAVSKENKYLSTLSRNEFLVGRIQELERALAVAKAGQANVENNPPASDVKGKIEKIDVQDRKLVEISVGSDQGLNVNHTLDVYRLEPQPEWLGTIKIVDTNRSTAIGRLIRLAGSKILVKVGDLVGKLGDKKADKAPEPSHLEDLGKLLETLKKELGKDQQDKVIQEVQKALDAIKKTADTTTRKKAVDALKEIAEPAASKKEELHLWLEKDPGQLGGYRAVLGEYLVALGGMSGPGRLGVQVEKPSAQLADQLDLPKGQGLVITEVKQGSPADKAGLKPNDILLKLNNQPVPGDVAAFVKDLGKIKSDTNVEGVVIRKGKQRNLQISLPAPKTATWLALPDGARHIDIRRTAAGFTTRYHEGKLAIDVTGTVEGGKPKVAEIRIQDGGESTRYDSVDRVPAQYRDRVQVLIQASAFGELPK